MSIFNVALRNALDGDEMLIAGAGYNFESCIQVRDALGDEKRLAREFHARHEIVNARLKKFNVLTNNFVTIYRYIRTASLPFLISQRC